MSELVINQFRFKKETGFGIFEDFLFPKLQLASWKMHGPFAIKAGDITYLVGRFHERGYHQGRVMPTNFRTVYVRPYFLFEQQPDKTYPDLPSAVMDLAGGELEVDYDIPVSFYNQIKDKVKLNFKPGAPEISGSIIKYDLNLVEQLLNNSRQESSRLAGHIMTDLKIAQREALNAFMKLPAPPRFTVLDNYLRESGLKAIIATSPLNVQELAAVPQRNNEGGILALYIAGSKEVVLLVSEEMQELRKGRAGVLRAPEFAGLIPEGVIGIEDEDMGMGNFIGLGLENRQIKNASSILRDWREEIAGGDLAFYILTALPTTYGIESALAEAKRRYQEGWDVTEGDIFNFFNERVDFFKERYGIPFAHSIYFANLHSGSRSESPSCHKPDFALKESNNSVKYDTGIKMYDSFGFLRGVSDLARTLCFNKPGQEVYEILEQAMLENGIPAARPGACGEDVYLASCRAIDQHLEDIKKKSLVPASIMHLEDVYARDTGHTMGKEEPANLCFKKGEKARLKVGMVCCFELQWGYRGHGFGIEDSFVITEKGPVIFSR